MDVTIIDAQGSSFGRICSFAAKQALEGTEIVIVNSEKALITGNKKNIIQKYKTLVKKGGHSQKGPRYSKIPYMMLKRGIRGMLPDHRRGIGKQAFLKIKCHNKIPEEFKEKEFKSLNKVSNDKHITLKELSEKI